MKIRSALSFCLLLVAFTWCGHVAIGQVPVNINSGDPAFPFPQFLEYQEGKSLAQYNAEGVTHADMEKSMREAWQIMANRFRYSGWGSPARNVDGVDYIISNLGCPYNCAEGAGYALLAAAYMGDKVTFDGIWMAIHDDFLTSVYSYETGAALDFDYRYGTHTLREKGRTSDAAADGDWDIGLALLMGYKQWGAMSGVDVADGSGGTKEMSYLEEAFNVIVDMVDTNRIEPLGSPGVLEGYTSGHIGIDGYPKGGNTFGENTTWGDTQNPFPSKEVFSNDGNQNGFASYTAPAYYRSFADFLTSEGGSAWCIEQYKRAEASSEWILGESYADNRLPFGGSFDVSGTTATVTDVDPTQGKCDGESFRMAWRTILNYMWRGDGQYTWDPVSHNYSLGTNTAMKDNADRLAEFLKVVGPLDGSGNPTASTCEQLGASPDVGSPSWKGLPTLKQGYGGDGTKCSGNNWTNFALGTSAPAAVSHGDEDLIARLYRQCELKWDDADPGIGEDEDGRYIDSEPKYFHGWFRLLGMLTLSGNLHAPENMVGSANMKVYMALDKTFGFGGDELTYTVNYRNYGSVDATGVTISIPIPTEFTVTNDGGGSQSGGNLNFNVGPVPGFTSAGGIAPTVGAFTFKVKINEPAVAGRTCINATIACTNGSGWMSNEYPNNESYTFELNCVDILETRSLTIDKTASASEVNPGDTLEFFVNFENSTEAGFLDGGRPGVDFSFTYSMYAGDYTLFSRFRNWHDAEEAYIDLANYRASYFMFDNANVGVYDAATNPTGWKLVGKNLRSGEEGILNFAGENIPTGQDAFGKWNQRILMYFPPDISAPTHFLYSHLGNYFQIHKGQDEPIWYEVKMESTPSSQLPSRLADDWSYDAATSTNNDKDLYHPITDHYEYGGVTTPVTSYGQQVCTPAPPGNFERVLIEEWDGTTWRRLAGNGPLPGREMLNVMVIDTIPAGFEFVEFTADLVEGINATMTTSGGYEIIEWTMPVMLVGTTGLISYTVKAKGACPQIDQFHTNTAWISSDTDSPLASPIEIKVTCDTIIPTATPTSMTKVADKTSVGPGGQITFDIEYTQTHGTINTPDLNSNTNWTTKQGGAPTYGGGNMTFAFSNPAPFVTHDYAYGHDGYAEFDVTFTGGKGFYLAFRHQAGAPFDANGVYTRIDMQSAGLAKITVFNGSTQLFQQQNVGLGTSGDDVTMKVLIHGDTLEYYFTNTTGLPTLTVTGVNDSQQGNFGIYNLNQYNSIDATVFSNMTLAFDAAFNVAISDPLSTGLTFLSSSDGSMIDAGGGLVTSTTTLPGPVEYGTVLDYTFTATVGACPPGGNFVNTAWANLLTHPTNSIGATTPEIACNSGACDQPTNITLTPDPASGEVCDPGTIELTANADGGTFEFEFYDQTGVVQAASASTTFTASISESYYVVVTDPNDPSTCTGQSTVVDVLIKPLPTATILTSGIDLEYCTGTTGVSLTADDAGTGATYTWSGPVTGTGIILVDATQGVYTVLVEKDGCDATSTSVTVSEVAGPTATILTSGVDLEYCAGTSGVTLTGDDAGVGATYTWSGPVTGTGITLADATMGDYTVTVDKGCSATSSTVSVIEKPSPVASIVTSGIELEYCEGLSGVTLTADDAGVGATYSWAGPVTGTGQGLSDATVGTYTLTVSLDGCDADATVDVSELTKPTATITAGALVYCEGTGGVDLTAEPLGADGYQWLKDNSLDITGATYTGATAGDYEVIVNVGGCLDTSSVTSITEDILPETSNAGSDFSICEDNTSLAGNDPVVGMGLWQQTAGATVTITTPGDFNSTVTGIIADGTYSFEWTLSNGTCPSNASEVTITKSSSATASVGISADKTALCAGELITFTATPQIGGNLTYQWLVNTLPVGANNNSYSYTPTAADDVQVRLTTDLACAIAPKEATSAVWPFTIDEAPSAVTIDQGVIETTCLEEVDLSASNPVTGTLSWVLSSGPGSLSGSTGAAITVLGLGAGASTVVDLINSNGACPDEAAQIVISRTGSLAIPDAGEDVTICESQLSETLSGNDPQGATAKWIALSGSISQSGQDGIASGYIVGENEYVYEFDNGSCTATDTVSIFVDALPATPTISGPDSAATCASNYFLPGNTPVVGTVVWQITSGTGVIINENDPGSEVIGLLDNQTLELNLIASDGVCSGPSTSFKIHKSGEITSPSAIVAGGITDLCMSGGPYNLIGNAPGAGESAYWHLESGIGVSIDDINDPLSEITMNSTGSTEIWWVIDNAVCDSAVAKLTINVSDVPSAAATIAGYNGDPICEGTTLTLSEAAILGADNHVWTYPSGTQVLNPGDDLVFTPLTIGTLSVAGQNACGIGPSSELILDIVPNAEPTISLVSLPNNSSAICEGEPMLFTASVANEGATPTYRWFINNSLQADNGISITRNDLTGATNVRVEMDASSEMCNTVSFAESEMDLVFEERAVSFNGKFILCEGEAGCFSEVVTGGGATPMLNWSGAVTSSCHTGMTNGANVTLTMETSNTCSLPAISHTETITVSGGAVAEIQTIDTLICEGEQISLVAVEDLNAMTYSWFKGESEDGVFEALGTNSRVLPNVATAGFYYLLVDDGNECIDSAGLVQVSQANIALAPTANPTFVAEGGSTTLSAGVVVGELEDLQFTWTDLLTAEEFGGEQVEATPIETTSYEVKAIQGHCSAEGVVVVVVREELEVPSAFTPNGDGNNETWNIPALVGYPQATVRIFNRWGNIVYEQVNGYLEPWDGMINGKYVPVGTYYYIIDPVAEEVPAFEGAVTIVR